MGGSNETKCFYHPMLKYMKIICANLVEQESHTSIIARWQVEEDENNYIDALKLAYIVLFPPKINKLSS